MSKYKSLSKYLTGKCVSEMSINGIFDEGKLRSEIISLSSLHLSINKILEVRSQMQCPTKESEFYRYYQTLLKTRG